MFKVPELSSPPSTPDRQTKSTSNIFNASHPSTTPAGPPPSSFTQHSTTPAAPPPSSFFGGNSFLSSKQAASPPRFSRNGSQGSPLKFGQSRLSERSIDAMDEDQDMNDFDVSIQERDQPLDGVEGIDYFTIAKSIAARPAPLREADDLIISSDRVLDALYAFDSESEDLLVEWEDTLAEAVQRLLHIWKSHSSRDNQTSGIGPGEHASNVAKATFLSSLLLPLHHPARRLPPSDSFRSSRRGARKPVSEVLLDWLREQHDPFPDDFREVMAEEDSPAASDRFWDVVFSMSVRGNVREACALLQAADFANAYSALEDGSAKSGYEGQQLSNVQRVVNRAVAVMETCPGLQGGDWDVRGADWSIYRKRIHQARLDLQTFAEGSDRGRDGHHFEADHFSLPHQDNSVSALSRRAQSKVPWSVYEGLKQLYGQILGWSEEVGAACADWVEGTIALAVWSAGEEGLPGKNSFRTSQRSFGHSRRDKVEERQSIGYQGKLKMSLRHVTGSTDEAELQVDTTDPVQVGLACIFEGDIEGLLSILKGWSATISHAVVEVAQFGHWLNDAPSPSKSLMQAFDKSDLMVLSVAKREQVGVDFDAELIRYADLLNGRRRISILQQGIEYEGWELAVQTLSRVRNEVLANEKVTEVLQALELNRQRVEKCTTFCRELDLPELGRKIAEKYADELAQSSSNYGEALIFYARAYNVASLKDVLRVLTSSCLVQSCAYPPARLLDPSLKLLLSSPAQVLTQLGSTDPTAAQVLSTHLSGYATLRRYYDLRDGNGESQSLRPLARRRAALEALVAVIMSAVDSIDGGLYDDSVESIVPIEGLLVLLGEVLPFVNQDTKILSASQAFAVMKAVEDLSIVSPTVAGQCDECFQSALAAAKGKKPASSKGSSKSGGALMKASGKGLEDVARAWDWRQGLDETTKAEDVLQILRLGLAREVSRAWMDVHRD